MERLNPGDKVQSRYRILSQLGSGGFTKPKDIEAMPNEAPGTLYDMINDPEEKNNLYSQYPEIVVELEQLLENYKSQGYSNK